MIPLYDQATCEECGGCVSNSRRQGDCENPIDMRSHSATARFWHTECASADQARYEKRLAQQAQLNPYTDTCLETVVDTTTRLSFPVRVF